MTNLATQALLFELRPHRSLTHPRARFLSMSVAVVVLGAASIMALHGGWPVLLFAGSVVSGTWIALRANTSVVRDDLQTIRITEEEIQLRYVGRSHSRTVTLQRGWTRVSLHPSRAMAGTSMLLLESLGKSHEVGSFLAEPERRYLEARLRSLVGARGALPSVDDETSR